MDDYCYAVQKGITAEESGKEYQQTLGYYGTLGSALTAIARDEAMSISYDTIQEYIDNYIRKYCHVPESTRSDPSLTTNICLSV